MRCCSTRSPAPIRIPLIEIDESDVTIGHEASVSKVGEEQLFYLMSRGLTQEQATTMVVSGFIEPLVKELPMEYAVEMNRLIQTSKWKARSAKLWKKNPRSSSPGLVARSQPPVTSLSPAPWFRQMMH